MPTQLDILNKRKELVFWALRHGFVAWNGTTMQRDNKKTGKEERLKFTGSVVSRDVLVYDWSRPCPMEWKVVAENFLLSVRVTEEDKLSGLSPNNEA